MAPDTTNPSNPNQSSAESASATGQMAQPVVATSDDGWTIESADANRPSAEELTARINEQPEPTESHEEPPASTSTPPASSEKPLTRDEKRSAAGRVATIRQQIDTLTREKGETQRERDAARAELDRLRAEANTLREQIAGRTATETTPPAATTTTPPATTTPAGEPQPTWEAFEANGQTYDQFLVALNQWTTKQVLGDIESRVAQTVAKTLTERETAAREAYQKTAAARAQAEAGAKHQTRLTAARQKYADFDQRIDPNQHLSQPMIDAIVRSEVGPEMMLYLADHKEDAARISTLHPILAIEEMGAIRARVEAAHSSGSAPASTPVVSHARPPIQPPGGSGVPPRDAGSSLEGDFGPDWIAAENRREQEAKRRRGIA